MRRSVSDVIKDVEQAEGALRKALEKVERALGELDAIEWVVNETGAAGLRPGPVPKARRQPGPLPSAQNFHLEVLDQGRAVISFGEGRRVPLTPALAALTAILVFGEGESPDGLVAWKSLDRIGQLLKAQFGRGFDHHAVLNLLSRLRKAFQRADVDPLLVESAPPVGARLRLKHRPVDLCAG